MTYQEALETKIRLCNICRENGKPTEAACNNCTDKVAIYAISKQIEKEPIFISGHPETFYICPDCGSTFVQREGIRMNYCNNCGQKIRGKESDIRGIKKRSQETRVLSDRD